MKKILLLIFTLVSAYGLQAQSNSFEKSTALQLVKANQTAIGLTAEDFKNFIVVSTYNNKFAGTVMVYIQQTYKDIPVYNQLQTLAFKNGVLVSKSGSRIVNIEKYVNVQSGIPAFKAEDALLKAISDRKINLKQSPVVLSSKNNGRKVEFTKMGISHENITAELMWFTDETGKTKLKLGWQVYIIQNTSSDYWLVNVDASNNSIIGIDNLTVYCDWDTKEHKATQQLANKNLKIKENQSTHFPWTDLISGNVNKSLNNQFTNSPTAVNTAMYRVVPYPAESPQHAGGTPALVTNPWDLSGTGSNATSLKWHTIGTTNYNITRGNNVWAQEDRANTNGTSVNQVTSTTSPDPLTFDFVPDFTLAPTVTTPAPNQQFNVTNLFYWNNIVHDLTYQYGFDEAARNFQGDNQGRGGVENDFVLADAQDGGGTNNANFSTPADGGKGRMQMFVWTSITPNKDGDVDNGIISHEYAHGISNRLTGNGFSCLGNAEQMGEGWSDYYGLMYTQDWATAKFNTGFTTPRGIGTYAINQPSTGLGIRSQRYCTDFTINNKVYAASIPTAPHSRGELWCAVLWDMTWAIINQVGSINPNLFNASSAGGNSIALKLVTEGLKLQPCSPGFISSRDAILQADKILYNGAYRCTILEAFRRRGMGLGASQGSSTSVTDQIPSFVNTVSAPLVLLQGGITAAGEGQNISYINRVTTDVCTGITGYTITDTLPLNVSYVSGGTYNAANRVVSFTVTQAPSTTIDYNFVVKINPGTYFPPVTLLNEPVPATMPSTWTAITTVPTGGSLWTASTIQSNSAPNAFYCVNEVVASDKRLELANGIAIPTGPSAYPKLTFSHKFDTEDGWDGGVVEISTNGGTTWTDLGANMLTNKYNGSLGAGTGNNLSNREAFTGLIPAFINTTVNLSTFAGQTAKIRFRFASDDNTAGSNPTSTGWFVDDVNITNTATVSMRSSIFNAAMQRTNFVDTAMLILSTPGLPPVIATQPSATTICAGATASFTAVANGATTFSWEQSTNGGTTFTAVTPATTTATLTLSAVTIGMNANQYRMVGTNGTGSATTNAALLTVNAIPAAPTATSQVNYCQGATATALGANGTSLLWYSMATGGTGSSTIPPVSTATVGITNYYVSQTTNSCESPRTQITVTVSALAIITSQPVDVTAMGTTAMFTVTASGTALTYRWQVSTNGGSTFTNIVGETNSTLTVTVLTTTQTNKYKVVVTGACGTETSKAVTATLASVPNVLVLSPNPTHGWVKTTYYSSSAVNQGKTITLYDGKGAKVMVKNFTVTGNYGTAEFDLSILAVGTYVVILSDGEGKKIASSSVYKN